MMILIFHVRPQNGRSQDITLYKYHRCALVNDSKKLSNEKFDLMRHRISIVRNYHGGVAIASILQREIDHEAIAASTVAAMFVVYDLK